MQPNFTLATAVLDGDLAEFEISFSTTIRGTFHRDGKVIVLQSSKTIKIRKASINEKVVNIRESA